MTLTQMLLLQWKFFRIRQHYIHTYEHMHGAASIQPDTA